MKLFILGILLGIFLWQTVCFIVALVTNEDEEKMIYTSVLLYLPIMIAIRQIVKLSKKLATKNYNIYTFYEKQANGGFNTFQRAMKPKFAKRFNVVKNKEDCSDNCFVVLIKEGKDLCSYPGKEFILNERSLRYFQSFDKFMKLDK